MIFTSTPLKGGESLCLLQLPNGNTLGYRCPPQERLYALDLMLTAAKEEPTLAYKDKRNV